jgi:S1-C subfamily serine protease
VILAAGGRRVLAPVELMAAVDAAVVGQPLSLRVNRNGSELNYVVVPREMAQPRRR